MELNYLFFSSIAAVTLVISSDIFSSAAPANDLVINLPGLNFKPNFHHYSGYLKASNTHFLHYWLTLSQKNPATAPVVLWLSGGPGCSSADGLLEELGPFHIKDNGKTVYENVYAWNKIANVLFIESPAGVGYSYATDGNITTNDDQTAAENRVALIDLFKNKFPEYKENDFYITGESYAGVYLPTLGNLLLSDPGNFPNFKGLAVGNPLLSYSLNINSLVPFLYQHGLISEKTWTFLSNVCCNRAPYVCDYYGITRSANTTACFKTLESLFSITRNMQHYNPYNMYFSCYLPSNTESNMGPLHIYHRVIFKHIQMENSKRPTRLHAHPQMKNGGSTIPLCAQYMNAFYYMNRQNVRQSLSIPSNLPQWTQCNSDLNSKYYHTQHMDMSKFILKLVQANKKVLIYNGDVDSVCNVMGNQKFVHRLSLPLIKDKTLWTYATDIPDAAGFVTKYNGVDFVTVRGSGHFVPLTKKHEALQMIANFIWNKPYSTPTNISVLPQPSVGGYCSQLVLSPMHFNGPVTASSLCGQGQCKDTANGAICVCPVGFSGKFCGTYTPQPNTVPIQLCAAYETAQTRAAGLRFGCPVTYTCVPYQYKCVTTLSCNYPIGYCLPWIHLQSMFPSMPRKLRRMSSRASRRQKTESHYARNNDKH